MSDVESLPFLYGRDVGCAALYIAWWWWCGGNFQGDSISFASTTGKHCIHIVHIRFFQGEWQQQRFSVFFEYKDIDGRFQKEQSTIRKCAGTQEGGNIFKSFNQSLQVSLRP